MHESGGPDNADGAVEAAPARVTIHRTSPQDAKQRQVIMSIDGQEVATLLYGQRATRAIAPGRHYLRAYNTLVWKTFPFEAAPGEDLHFTVVNRAAPGMMWMVGLFGAGPMSVSIERGDQTPSAAPPSPSAPSAS
jgi:hypothetical protein